MDNPKTTIVVVVAIILIVTLFCFFHFKSFTVTGTLTNKYVNEFVTTTSESLMMDEDGNLDTVGEDTTSLHRQYIVEIDGETKILVRELVATVQNHDSDAVNQCLSKMESEPVEYTYLSLNRIYVMKLHGIFGVKQLEDATLIDLVKVENK